MRIPFLAIAILLSSAASGKDPREPAYGQAQLDAMVKDIRDDLWVDNVKLVRKSL